MAKGIVLASGSIHRRELLKNAGVDFTVEPSTSTSARWRRR